jgi:hypothetical protein
MFESNDAQPVGGPEPAKDEDGLGSIIRWGGLAAVSAGGVILFGALTSPVRLSGATRSSRIVWEQRQAEIDKAVSAEDTPAGQPALAPNTPPRDPGA